MSRSTEGRSPQLSGASGFSLALFGAMQRRQQTPRIAWRPEQVRGLNQPGEFIGRNESNVSRAFASNDYSFLLVDNPVQNAGQILTQTCVCGLSCHLPPFP